METIEEKTKINRISSLITVWFLVVVLCLPFIQMRTRVFPDLPTQENRALAIKPVIKSVSLSGLWNYIQDFQKYFNDNFGFRNVLIRVNSFANLKILGVSPTPLADIVAGKQGWLFYNVPNDGSSFEDYYGLAGFSANQLSAIRENMVRLRKESAARNMLLIIAVAPSKHTIYEEYLPTRVSMMKGSVSRVDQLCTAWGKNDARASFVDTRNFLVRAKKEFAYPLYYKTDSHWNNLGAFVAYSDIMREVNARINGTRLLTLADFRLSSTGIAGRDLAKMVNLPDLMSDTDVTLTPRMPFVAQQSAAPYAYGTAIMSEIQNCKGKRVVAFGDSFLWYLIPYLSESFCKGIFLGAPLTVDFSIIDKEKPDVMIVELAERYAGSLKIAWPASSQKKERAQRWVFPP